MRSTAVPLFTILPSINFRSLSSSGQQVLQEQVEVRASGSTCLQVDSAIRTRTCQLHALQPLHRPVDVFTVVSPKYNVTTPLVDHRGPGNGLSLTCHGNT